MFFYFVLWLVRSVLLRRLIHWLYSSFWMRRFCLKKGRTRRSCQAVPLDGLLICVQSADATFLNPIWTLKSVINKDLGSLLCTILSKIWFSIVWWLCCWFNDLTRCNLTSLLHLIMKFDGWRGKKKKLYILYVCTAAENVHVKLPVPQQCQLNPYLIPFVSLVLFVDDSGQTCSEVTLKCYFASFFFFLFVFLETPSRSKH